MVVGQSEESFITKVPCYMCTPAHHGAIWRVEIRNWTDSGIRDPELDVERLTGAQEQRKPVLLFDEKLKVLIQVRILLEESLRSRTPEVALDGLRMLLIAQRVSLLSFDDIMP